MIGGVEQILQDLRGMGSEHNRQGMGRFGINVEQAFGISMTNLRAYARTLGRDHELAKALWQTGWHETRLLATIIALPKECDPTLMEDWVKDINSWDLCDQACMNLFRKTPYAWQKHRAWAGRPECFVKRAGFALSATLAVHDKKAPDDTFLDVLSLINAHAGDDRNFVKKAVNWSLRQIGKRNRTLNDAAVSLALELSERPEKSARWIGRVAYRELNSEKVQSRL